MKLLAGWVVSVGVLATTAGAHAQTLQPYRLGPSPYVAASDVGGPYAPPPRYVGPSDIGASYDAPAVLAPHEIYNIVRESGFSPLGAPLQRGLVYTMSVIDLDGEDGRLVIDGRSGRVLRFMPAFRMGDRMGIEINSTYGPAGPLPPRSEIGRVPRPPMPVPRLASRTPTPPLPKALPPRAVAEPLKPVATRPATATPAPVPAQQSAAVQAKPVDGLAVAPPAPVSPAPAAVAPVEAKPAAPLQPTQAMPPAQGLE